VSQLLVGGTSFVPGVYGSVSQNWDPDGDDIYDLGESANRWRDLYLGPGTLYIGTAGDQASVSYDTVDNALRFGINGVQSLFVDLVHSNSAIGSNALK
jgi:hypothetical protein